MESQHVIENYFVKVYVSLKRLLKSRNPKSDGKKRDKIMNFKNSIDTVT